HAQDEALALSDRIAVMNCGRLEQIGTPKEVYDQPNTSFVATFIGQMNRIQGQIVERHGDATILRTAGGTQFIAMTGKSQSLSPGDAATLLVRPERIRIMTDKHSTADQGGDWNAVEVTLGR